MKSKTVQKVIIAVLLVAILVCAALLAGEKFGWFDKLKTAGALQRGNPQVGSPVSPDGSTPASASPDATRFVSLGNKTTGAGELPMYRYTGGYAPELDPYSVKYDSKLKPEAYGIKIEGNTPLEKISLVVLRYALSPEELTHFRVQMAMPGTEVLTSMALENEYANWLRTQLTPSQYDAVVNETLTYFYDRFWNFETSTDWVLENILIDEVSGSHDNSLLKGRLSSDDEVKNLLITCVDKNGNNFISSKLGFDNTYRDAGASYTPLDERAWIDLDEGGTWKWKKGASGTPDAPSNPPDTPVNPPAPQPDPPQPDPPGPQPHKDPADNPSDPVWSGPLTPGHDTDPYEPERPAPDPQPAQPSQPEPVQPPPAVVQPAEDCNGNGSTADEQASAVREDLAPAPAPVVDSGGNHPAQAPTQEVAAQPEVPAVSGGFEMPAIED
ncbi:hypothetical protein IJI17_03305 [Candidatus Saccharibacteria bacterium]|nr:hypothetical protein [Candidatus Saccharibacteria bacterium]